MQGPVVVAVALDWAEDAIRSVELHAITRPVSCSYKNTIEPESQGSRTRTEWDAGGPKGELAFRSSAAPLYVPHPILTLEPIAVLCCFASQFCSLGNRSLYAT